MALAPTIWCALPTSAQPLVPVGSEFQVDGADSHDSYRPDVSMSPSGRFVVVWHNDVGGGIFGQRYLPEPGRGALAMGLAALWLLRRSLRSQGDRSCGS